MEQSKSPKACAYARLGKQLSGKHSVPEEHLKMTRNSTGNIYDALINQFDPEQGKYIRNLVTKQQKVQNQSASTAAIHNRKKSYADLQPQEKQKSSQDGKREERETLCKPKFQKDNPILHQVTPKHNPSPMSRSDFIRPNKQFHSSNLSGFMRKQSKEDINFLDNLNNYLQSLHQSADHSSQLIPERFTQTLKYPIAQGQDSYALASKLEQSMTKIKQLKLKKHYMEKESSKFGRRQKKMKQCLYQMLEELKVTNTELARQKRERKRLEKVIDSFQLQQKPERKTIGKHLNLSKIQEFQHKINLFTQNQGSDLQSSIRDVWKQSSYSKKNRQHDRQYSHFQPHGMLDSQKINQMFKSGFHSQDDDSYDQ